MPIQFELVTPERFFAPEMGGLNVVPYMQIFTRHHVTITTMTRVRVGSPSVFYQPSRSAPYSGCRAA